MVSAEDSAGKVVVISSVGSVLIVGSSDKDLYKQSASPFNDGK